MDVLRVRAVGQDVRNVLVDERRFLEPPVDLEDEVAILDVAPERLVALGLALGVVVDHAVNDFPVPAVALWYFPAGQVLAVEERDKALGGLVVGPTDR